MMAIVSILTGVSALFVFDENLRITLVITMILANFGVWLANTNRLTR
jgi:hypothetical protein